MISNTLLVVLVIGVILMSLLIMLQMRQYDVALWKSVPIAVFLVLAGVVGSYIWYFVENLSFGGRSFYGAVVLSPIIFLPVSRLLRLSYSDTMDFIAPAGCVTLAMVKIDCLLNRCCQGKILYVNQDDIFVRFPSQIVEMVVFLIISAILMCMVSRKKYRGTIYPWFLVLYGASRFVLDFFRDIKVPYALGLSAGSFWSLCSIIVGLILLLIVRYRHKHQDEAESYGVKGSRHR